MKDLYNTKEDRWNTLFGEIGFLGKLARSRKDYEDTIAEYEWPKFRDWLYEVYGVSVTIQGQSLTADYEVHDEQKFLLFELKYTI